MTVLWFTGLPASGKSTLARRVDDALRASGQATCLLDSDELRDVMGRDFGYDDTGRDAFYAMLARMAALLASQGLTVLVAATAPKRRHRDAARSLTPRFLEIFVDTPLERCRERDPKGLYARAAADPQSTLPGVGVPYEAPDFAEVRITDDDVDVALAEVLDVVATAAA